MDIVPGFEGAPALAVESADLEVPELHMNIPNTETVYLMELDFDLVLTVQQYKSEWLQQR